MATLQNILDGLKNTRETTTRGPSFTDKLDKVISALESTQNGLLKLSDAVNDQVALNKAAEKVGKASDVQKTIKAMLEAQIKSDEYARAREDRLRSMVEGMVHPVTDEQIQAFREQKEAYSKHQKAMEASLATEKDRVELQKKLAQDVADKQLKVATQQLNAEKARIETAKAEAEFAKTDKYGTIGSAVGKVESMAKDPFTKFLVQGLGRYIKEKKEAPVADKIKSDYEESMAKAQGTFDRAKENIQGRADEKKALYEKASEKRSARIREDFDIEAARKNIVDPGAVTSLFKAWNQRVVELTQKAIKAETSLVTKSRKARKEEPAETKTAEVVSDKKAEKPVEVKGSTTRTFKKPAQGRGEAPGAPVATVRNKKITSSDMLENIFPEARTFKRTGKGTKGLATPSNGTVAKAGKTGVQTATKAVGALGSKAGMLNLGVIGKGVSMLSKNFMKFLGPWGMVASVLMSFDKMIPLLSTGVGALLDLTKLVVPLLTSSLIEGFAQLLRGFNALLGFLDRTFLGSHLQEQSVYTSKYESASSTRRGELGRVNSTFNPGVSSFNGIPISKIKGYIGQQQLPQLTQLEEKALTMPSTELGSEGVWTGLFETASFKRFIEGAETLPGFLQSIEEAIRELGSTRGTTPIPDDFGFGGRGWLSLGFSL